MCIATEMSKKSSGRIFMKHLLHPRHNIDRHGSINENNSNNIDRYPSLTAFYVPRILSYNPDNNPFIFN